MCEPLPRWSRYGVHRFLDLGRVGGIMVSRAWSPTDDAGWLWCLRLSKDEPQSTAPDLAAAKLAAEDAARAMVAEMAAALGARTLIWADAEEGGE